MVREGMHSWAWTRNARRTYRVRLAVSLLTKPWSFCDRWRLGAAPAPIVASTSMSSGTAGSVAVVAVALPVAAARCAAKDQVDELAEGPHDWAESSSPGPGVAVSRILPDLMERMELNDDLDLRDAAKRLSDDSPSARLIVRLRAANGMVESCELDGVCDLSLLRENQVNADIDAASLSLSLPLSLELHRLSSSGPIGDAAAKRLLGEPAATLSDCMSSSSARSTPCCPLTLYARGEAVGVWYTADDFLRLGVSGAASRLVPRCTGARIRGSRYRLIVGESSGAVSVKKTSTGRVH